MTPRRLLTLGHSYVLGVNRRLAHELAAQSHGRWEVTASAPRGFHGSHDIRPLDFEPLQSEPIKVEVLPARFTNHIQFFHYGAKLKRLIRSGFDLVHAWEEPYILAGLQIARAVPKNVPLVFRSAQSLNKRYLPPFNWIERYSVRRMAGWICSGKLVENNLLARQGYADRPHRLITLGVDLANNQPNPAAGRDIRRQLGWDDSIPVIGYLGRFVSEKGISLLMNVLDALQTPWRAMFVGDGPMAADMKKWADARHPDRVRLCTDVLHSEVPAYLNAMSVLVAPSQTTPRWKEQFGRMLIEAFACGVPVIGSDSGEIPAVIADSGVVCGERDQAAWVQAISSLLESPIRLSELAERGLARAPQYGWDVVARRHIEFFDELMDRRR